MDGQRQPVVRAASASVMQQYPTQLRRPMSTRAQVSRASHGFRSPALLPRKSPSLQARYCYRTARTAHPTRNLSISPAPARPALVFSSPHLSTQHHPACLLRRVPQRVASRQTITSLAFGRRCILLPLPLQARLPHLFACLTSPGRSRHPDYRKEQSTPPVPRLHRYFATRAHHGLHFV